MWFLPKFRFGRSKSKNNQTVADLAAHARRKLISELGEAGFARACLAFDSQIEAEAICPDLIEVGFEAHLHEPHTGLPTRLAGQGWGHLTLKHLLEQ